jgi:hypothetical protein
VFLNKEPTLYTPITLQLVSEAAKTDLALQLIMDQLSKSSTRQEAMKNDNEGKLNTGQDKMENSMTCAPDKKK